jgi:Uma2 family endonuclease
MNPSHTRLTYEDFLKFPDDEQRHELIDGEHYVTPSPNTRHQRLVVRLVTEFENYFRGHRAGQVFCAPFDCVFTNFDVVEPDLLVVLGDQIEILTEQNVRGAPAIVIEILSPGTSRRDRGIKRDLYDRGGVREYWIIDPVDNTIQVLGRSTSLHLTSQSELPAPGNDELTTPLLPGFSLNLADLFKTER